MCYKRSMTNGDGNDENLFVQHGCQYYAAARFAMYAQCMPITGILFHYAVEMFLKGGLARKRTLSELEGMRHRLKLKIWRAFKTDFPEPDLKRHDGTISSLDKFGVIRYPDAILKHGMGTTAQWGSAAEVITYGRMKLPRRYVVVVSDIDDLVADVFKAASWNPGTFIATNSFALEAITRYNNHAEFLTTPLSCTLPQ